MSSIFATELIPDATTSMSNFSKFLIARSINSVQFISLSGRKLIVTTSAPRILHSSLTFLRASLFPAARTSLHPAPANAFAATVPNAPDAPVIKATLLLKLNKESGLLNILVMIKRSLDFYFGG